MERKLDFDQWVRMELESLLRELNIAFDEISRTTDTGSCCRLTIKPRGHRSFAIHFERANKEVIEQGQSSEVKAGLKKMLKVCLEDWRNKGLRPLEYFLVSDSECTRSS
jgi:hypothetical protein